MKKEISYSSIQTNRKCCATDKMGNLCHFWHHSLFEPTDSGQIIAINATVPNSESIYGEHLLQIINFFWFDLHLPPSDFVDLPPKQRLYLSSQLCRTIIAIIAYNFVTHFEKLRQTGGRFIFTAISFKERRERRLSYQFRLKGFLVTFRNNYMKLLRTFTTEKFVVSTLHFSYFLLNCPLPKIQLIRYILHGSTFTKLIFNQLAYSISYPFNQTYPVPISLSFVQSIFQGPKLI